MKRLYKSLVTILVSIILTNALLSSVVFADEKKDPFLSHSNTNYNEILTQNVIKKYGEEGTATGASEQDRPVSKSEDGRKTENVSDPHDRDTNLKSEQFAFVGTILASVVRIIPKTLQAIMSQCVGTNSGTEELFTIENLLMDRYDLFDINIFNTSSDMNFKGQEESVFNKVIKESVALWYSSIRNFAIVLSLIALLYIAIRMAISTTVTDRVKYKKMLASWFIGFALIFILHYIAIIMITVSEQLVRLLSSIAPTDQQPFEYAVMYRMTYAEAKGWNSLIQAILYFMLVWYEAKFFFMYLKRVISNAFLILIAPLVTVTYAIDKASDHKAQAFNSWLNEMITNVFIQPLHLLLFLILLYSAGTIAELYPIVAILFLFGLDKAEKLLRGLLKLRGGTIEGIEEGMTFSGLVSRI